MTLAGQSSYHDNVMNSNDFRIAEQSDEVKKVLEVISAPVLGQRSTRQRKLICDILAASTEHLDVETLYRHACDIDSRVSLSTVYRTISLLKEANMVDELVFEDDRRCYEFKHTNGLQHHHVRCLSCGDVFEFETDYADRLKDNIMQSTGFQVESLKIDVSGYCRTCGIP